MDIILHLVLVHMGFVMKKQISANIGENIKSKKANVPHTIVTGYP